MVIAASLSCGGQAFAGPLGSGPVPMSARADEKMRELAVQQMYAGNMEIALETLNEVIALNPNNAQAYYDRGMVHEYLGDLSAARSDLSLAIQLSTKFGAAHVERAKIFLAQHLYQDALADLAIAMNDKEQGLRATYWRGRCYYAMGKTDKAETDLTYVMQRFQELNDKDAYDVARVFLSKVFHQDGLTAAIKGDYARAIASYNRALQLNPESAGTLLDRAIAEDATGDENNALSDLNSVIAKAPLIGDAHTQRGNILFKMNQIEAAEREYIVALQIDPRDADAHYAKGRCLQILGYRDLAMKEFKAAKTLYAYVENSEGMQAADSRISELA
jgi:tetratricopeptide (TPR) repeat protein